MGARGLKERGPTICLTLKRGSGVLLEKEGLFERGGLIQDLQWYSFILS